MSICKCGHKIVYTKGISWALTPLDIEKLSDNDFKHIDNPKEIEIDNKKMLDMTSRTLSDECPYCECNKVKIAHIGEEGISLESD